MTPMTQVPMVMSSWVPGSTISSTRGGTKSPRVSRPPWPPGVPRPPEYRAVPVGDAGGLAARGGAAPPPFREKEPKKGQVPPSSAHLLCHYPMDKGCEICRRAKVSNAPARRQPPLSAREQPEDALVEKLVPTRFGDLITADHVILGSGRNTSRSGDTAALVCYDRASGALGVYPMSSKGAEETIQAFHHFVPPTVVPKLVYTDCSPELSAALRNLQWRHDTATPYRPQTNGVAERAVRRVVDGTKSVLLASGLEHCWWREASECFAILHNISSRGPSGKTPYEAMHGEPFEGFIVPFGAQIRFKPQGPLEHDAPKFGDRTRLGIFIGYHMHSGMKWSNDYLVLDAEQFTNSGDGQRSHVHRIKELIVPPIPSFPIKTGVLGERR